jgi:uncharacterized protein YjbI with pentapeptide repeats
MADPEHEHVVRKGADSIRLWREDHPDIRLKLASADFDGVDLRRAPLSNADLFRAHFREARLQDADLRDCLFFWTDFTGADLRGANLSNAIFTACSFMDAILVNANLHHARFFQSNLQGAALTGAVLTESGFNRTPLTGVDLSGLSLKEACFDETDLYEANLNKANLYKSSMRWASLVAASLEGANLWKARLDKADLSGANLNGADLRWALLKGANLQRARLCGASLNHAELKGAVLTKADLSNADLQEACLEGAYLREANLSNANLEGARLEQAELLSANLSGARVRGANLWNADLKDAILTGVDLSETIQDHPTYPPDLGGRVEYSFRDPKSADATLVEVFYATDRRPTGNTAPGQFYGRERGEEGKELTFGRCEVSIPRDHKMGGLESPSIWRLEFREEPTKHVILMTITQADEKTFFHRVNVRMSRFAKRAAFVFIHGYNVSFEDAARRTAQLSYDLGFEGAPIFYSWPSHGVTAKYVGDETAVEWTEPHLEEFLDLLCTHSGAQTIRW